MRGYILGAVLFLGAGNSYSADISCTVSPTNNIVNITLPSSVAAGDIVTAGLSADTTGLYRELYTWKSVYAISVSVSCSPRVNMRFLQYVISPYGNPVKNGNYWIFPTGISGIGLSFNERTYTSGNPIGTVEHPWEYGPTTFTSMNTSIRTEIKVWKIPGAIGNINGKNLDFSNFQVVYGFQLANSSDNYVNLPSTQSNYPLARSLTVAAATYSGSLRFSSGTCNLTNKTVEMGSYKRSELTNYSPWVNASFTLNCPETWGYGTTANMSGTTANTITSRNPTNTATSGIIVTVSPRNGTVDGTRGIIGLKPGGAEGYGIQLAWGDSTSLSTGNPAKPVLFEQSQVVSDENFGTSGNTYTREIKMAARYTRTSGSVQPGSADSAIEILASYN